MKFRHCLLISLILSSLLIGALMACSLKATRADKTTTSQECVKEAIADKAKV